MQLNKTNSLKVKFFIIYFSFSFILIFSMIYLIMDIQSELIADASMYKSKDLVNNIVNALKKYNSGISLNKNNRNISIKHQLEDLNKFMKKFITKYLIITAEGNIIYKSHKDVNLPENINNIAQKVYYETDFTGNTYLAFFNKKSNSLDYYIPLHNFGINNLIIYLKYNLKDITKYNIYLYHSILLISILVIIVNIIISLIIFKLIIIPIDNLYKGTQKIKSGDYSFKIKIKRNDELGILTDNFNKMSETISTQILTLNKQKEELRQLAIIDTLTGIYNRRFFLDKLKYEIDKYIRYGTTFSLIMIDIDHFKHINDTYGHDAGDLILKNTCNIFKTNTRESDIVARYGGEEFMILSPENNIEEAYLHADKIRKSIEQSSNMYNNSINIKITASFGVATVTTIDKSTPNIDTVITSNVDMALYEAKETGRNKVIKYSEELRKK